MNAGAAGRGVLAGATVMVTRPKSRAPQLTRMLRERGARTVSAPTISLSPARSEALASSIRDLRDGRFDWIVLTSPTTVGILAEGVGSGRALRAKAAAIGEGTAEAYRDWTGRSPELVPRTFTTAALSRAFPSGAGRVLCARADIAPPGLEEALASKGWTTTRVIAYRTQLAEQLPRAAIDALERGDVDVVTFTSVSTVAGFARAVGAEPYAIPLCVCIGPVTAAEARRRGYPIGAVATEHTSEGLVAAVELAHVRRLNR